MKPLSMLKGIRSSVLDPYSYSSERKAERAFLSYFVSQVDALIDLLSTHNKADILIAINLFENVRGYGHVRAASMTKAKLQMESSLRRLSIDEQTYAAQTLWGQMLYWVGKDKVFMYLRLCEEHSDVAVSPLTTRLDA